MSLFKFSTNLLLSKYLSSNFSLILNFTSISRKQKVIFQVKFSTQSNFSTEI